MSRPAITAAGTSDLQHAVTSLGVAVGHRERYVAQLEAYTNRIELECEEALRDAGRLRARIDELESGSGMRSI